MKAYRCDRCRNYFEGVPVRDTETEIVWDELHFDPEHKLLATIQIDVNTFYNPDINVDAYVRQPEFCDECLTDMAIIAIRNLRPSGIVMWPPLEDHPAGYYPTRFTSTPH